MMERVRKSFLHPILRKNERRNKLQLIKLIEEDIVIPHWDLTSLTTKQMDILRELWKKRSRKHKLRAKKRRN